MIFRIFFVSAFLSLLQLKSAELQTISWSLPEGWQSVDVGRDHFPRLFMGPNKVKISQLKHEFQSDAVWVICKVYREELELPLVTESELEKLKKSLDNGAELYTFSNDKNGITCAFYVDFGTLWVLKFKGTLEEQKSISKSFIEIAGSIKPNKEFTEYVEKIKEKAAEDNKSAMTLSQLYDEGRGVDKDPKKAFEILIDLHKKDYLDATYRLAQKYLAVNKISNAFTLLQKGVDGNHLPSIKMLAALYLDYKNDRVEAHSLLKKAAERGDTESMFYLGTLYSVAGEFKDEKQAFKWITMAAQKDHIPAFRQLGVFYRSGFGVERNTQKAVDLLTQASEKGDVSSLEILADIYKSGEFNGKKDYEKSRECLFTAALKGSKKALLMTAELYLNGEGVKKDIDKGVSLMKQASEKGVLEADLNLGDMYTLGNEIKQDFPAAYSHYMKAAEAGNKYGMFKVALALLSGKGVEKDGEAAVRWLKRAAKLGYAPAIKALKDTGF